MYRVKTANDLTKEVLQVFKSVEKRQGQGNNGKSYDRYEIVKEKLNYRWKSPKAIRQFDKNEVMRAGLGDELVDAYVKLKMKDWNEYTNYLSEWEREHTLDC